MLTQDATASLEKSTSEHDDEPDEESGQDWITRFLKGGHDFLWPGGLGSSACPTLLTGLKTDASDHLIDNLMEWERKFESADLEKHKQFLQEAQLLVCDNPPEATAWENGFVPEARGIPADQLEFRIQGRLPTLAYMVSRPRQPTIAGEDLMRRFDAGVRPCWLRDWQTGFGGYTKVYEYQAQWRDKAKNSLLHMWFDHGPRLRMPVSVSPCCRTCLIRSHRKDQLAQVIP